MFFVFFTLFVIQTVSGEKHGSLPFDDDDQEVPTSEDSENSAEKPILKAFSMPDIKILSLIEIIGLREVIVVCILILYIIFYIIGRKSIQSFIKKTIEGTCAALDKYYKGVPKRFTANSLHRYDSYSTGRTTHKGVLTTLSLSKRCDILGYLFDKYNNVKSTLTFEVIVDQPQQLPLIIHISDSAPKFSKQFNLLKYPVSDDKLACFSDFEESLDIFLPEINEFIEKHPGLVKLIEISDGNRFELRSDCRFVVCAQFNIEGNEEVVFSSEVVDFVVKIADKYATLNVDKDILERMQRSRKAIINEQKEDFEKKGYKFVQKEEKKQ